MNNNKEGLDFKYFQEYLETSQSGDLNGSVI